MLKTVIVNSPAPDWVLNPLPLLGPSILKTFLDSKGYKIDLVDLAVRVRYLNRYPLRKIFNLELFQSRKRVINFLENYKDNDIRAEIEKIIKLGNLTNYDVIGFSLNNETDITFSLCIAKILKERYNKKIVFGGPIENSSDYINLLDFDFVDFLVVGDGEEPFLNILRYFEGVDNIKNCNGICYKKGRKIYITKPSTFPIEKKPLPSFNIEDLKLYKKLSTKKLSMLPYLLTRGCRFKCAFCSYYKSIGFSYTPLEKVISDIKFLLKTYQANSIFFTEGNMNNSPQYMKELSECIIKEKLKFYWGGLGTIFGLNESIIKIMAKAGCKFVFVGIETASEYMPDRMNIQKASNLKELKETLKLLHKYGIKTHNFYIVEFPYETYDDFKKTINFIKETAKYTTTAHSSLFVLTENSLIFQAPQTFQIKIRKKRKSSFLCIGHEFDEINGLKWEEKYKRGDIKERIVNKIIFKEIMINFILKSLLKNPLYLIKRKISHPYLCFDEYFI
jgi:radical SAM superfamily enzyme YgiQ (UPF0313 family)